MYLNNGVSYFGYGSLTRDKARRKRNLGLLQNGRTISPAESKSAFEENVFSMM
jgi:hypothetical protein